MEPTSTPPRDPAPVEREKLTPPKTPERLKSLRTYQGDVADAISKNNTSIATIALAEQKRINTKPELKEVVRPEPIDETVSPWRNQLFVYGGSILIICGIIGLGVAVYNRGSQPGVVASPDTHTILPSTETAAATLPNNTRSDILSFITTQQKSYGAKVNNVLYIHPLLGTSTMPLSFLLPLLAPQAPSFLIRSFSDEYMIGIYSYDTNMPFILLRSTDFNTSFAGMLRWEAGMPTDLGLLFGIDANHLDQYTWGDESVKNKDMRILHDQNGKTVLLYSFIDKNTLLITGNERVFSAILARYSTGSTTR